MSIRRAGPDDTHLFTRRQLDYGACCFYTEDGACRYYFEICGQEATLMTDRPEHTDAAIDAFLFYSGFVTRVVDARGRQLRQRQLEAPCLLDIACIQPSQFYINRRKLESCKRWIRGPGDIMIPVATIDGKTVALDGHTRLRAALDLGYTSVYTYPDDSGDYIAHFVAEAVGRGIERVADMETLTDAEYKVKWHRYCDDFFKNQP